MGKECSLHLLCCHDPHEVKFGLCHPHHKHIIHIHIIQICHASTTQSRDPQRCQWCMCSRHGRWQHALRNDNGLNCIHDMSSYCRGIIFNLMLKKLCKWFTYSWIHGLQRVISHSCSSLWTCTKALYLAANMTTRTSCWEMQGTGTVE